MTTAQHGMLNDTTAFELTYLADLVIQFGISRLADMSAKPSR